MTDYKPGTIAKATVRGVPDVTVARTSDELPWIRLDGPGVGSLWVHDRDVADVRPLVVLDWHPSPTHLNDLLGLLREHYWTSLADQIEAQTRPAIEEPKGLGAVVEDADGNRYVRGHGAINPWGGPSIFKRWHEVDAVRVVWAGVQS